MTLYVYQQFPLYHLLHSRQSIVGYILQYVMENLLSGELNIEIKFTSKLAEVRVVLCSL